MTDTGAAGATWSAGATTASSSAPTTTPKDDCCERPQGGGLAGGLGSGGVRQQTFGWGPWSDWTACRRVHNFSAGRCRKVRTRKCVGQQCGSSLQHSEDLQEQYCRES